MLFSVFVASGSFLGLIIGLICKSVSVLGWSYALLLLAFIRVVFGVTDNEQDDEEEQENNLDQN